MSEPQDPLRSLFHQAGAVGQARAAAPPVARIAARGRRAYRRRMAVLAAGACLVIAAGGTAVAALLPGRPVTVAPAGPPSLRLGPSSTSPPPMRDLPLPGRTTLGAPTMPSGGSLESTYPPTTQPPSYPTRTSPSSP